MTETTQEERDTIRQGADYWTEKLLNDADRLAQYESQCISRTADMPADAVGWLKDGYHGALWVIAYHQTVGAMDVPSFTDAPDLLPDEPGPVYRHIVDVE